MIVIPRGLARSFRAVLRKCQAPRSPLPTPVLVEVQQGTLHLSCSLDEVLVQWTGAHPGQVEARVGVPMTVLDAVENAAVELTVDGRQGRAQWTGRDGPRSLAFPHEEPDSGVIPRFGDVETCPVAPAFLTALHECGRTAARDSGRYALNRVQVNGQAGTVTATDARNALVYRGFKLSFQETFLVPALPVLGVKEITREARPGVGLVGDRLLLSAGPWTIAFVVDRAGRFPDVKGIIPKPAGATVVAIDNRDAEELLARMPEWPDASDGSDVVTLDIEDHITVRARNDEHHIPVRTYYGRCHRFDASRFDRPRRQRQACDLNLDQQSGRRSGVASRGPV